MNTQEGAKEFLVSPWLSFNNITVSIPVRVSTFMMQQLLSSITRFYVPTGGQVTIDGNNASTNQFRIAGESFVSRGFWQNIAYDRPEASHAEIIDAAKLANAHSRGVNKTWRAVCSSLPKRN